VLKRNENEGGDFIENRRLELSFLETGAYLYFLFIYFFIFLVTDKRLMKWDRKKLIRKKGVLQKGYEILKQKKETSKPFLLFFCFKISYSFLDLIL
jgi:hypothetical protein